jgi:hypothetical protein
MMTFCIAFYEPYLSTVVFRIRNDSAQVQNNCHHNLLSQNLVRIHIPFADPKGWFHWRWINFLLLFNFYTFCFFCQAYSDTTIEEMKEMKAKGGLELAGINNYRYNFQDEGSAM